MKIRNNGISNLNIDVFYENTLVTRKPCSLLMFY
jgi:hypothetical protein